jgi:MOSC domain-containing protein YiiM
MIRSYDQFMSAAQGHVIAINISPGGIPKRPIPSVRVEMEGLEGDAHDHECHRTPRQAVSLLDVEMIDALVADGFLLTPGATGENLTLRDVHVQSLPIGTRLAFPGGLELEITKVRRPCFVLDSISPELKKAAVGRLGAYAKVLVPGVVSTGDLISVLAPAEAPLAR